MSTIVVEYEGALRCRAVHESGAVLVTEAPKDNHGTGESFSPSELLAVSLGSCILSIMGVAAQTHNIDITGAKASVHKAMGNAPRRITKLTVTIHMPRKLAADEMLKLERAAHACPVHNVLKPEIDASINFQWGE